MKVAKTHVKTQKRRFSITVCEHFCTSRDSADGKGFPAAWKLLCRGVHRRPRRPAGWLALAGLLAVLTFALTWIAMAIGLVTKTPCGANSMTLIIQLGSSSSGRSSAVRSCPRPPPR
ncbi:hypothetical protein [Specibacter cremeus]|uniref:hypothetical protein n=1 Tax=Specibacter cremeus TaxID=1629051 RepID=UPI000F7914D9|nr:hypothetical protein [Specibacter cremeus]